jgi:hypothetical protein
LIAVQARPLIEKINARLEPLALALPTAARMLQTALAQVEAPVAV